MKDKRKNKLALPMALGGAVLAALAIDSRYRLEAQELEISSPRLPKAFDGFRIAQLSDLHGMVFGKSHQRLIDAVYAQEPDIIALTGDFVDKQKELIEFESLISRLALIAPVYFVSGNHDMNSGLMMDIAQVLNEYGVTYLNNKYLPLEKDGERIIICGVEDFDSFKGRIKPDELIEGLRTEYPEDYVLLLGHRNYWMERYPNIDVDAVLCGHGHGGIIRLPGLGGVIGTNMDLFPDNAEVVYKTRRYDLIISRGLGNKVPIPRILNNPHLPLVILRTESNI